MIIATAISLLCGLLVAFDLVRVFCGTYFVFNDQDDSVGIFVCIDSNENVNSVNLGFYVKGLDQWEIHFVSPKK